MLMKYIIIYQRPSHGLSRSRPRLSYASFMSFWVFTTLWFAFLIRLRWWPRLMGDVYAIMNHLMNYLSTLILAYLSPMWRVSRISSDFWSGWTLIQWQHKMNQHFHRLMLVNNIAEHWDLNVTALNCWM